MNTITLIGIAIIDGSVCDMHFIGTPHLHCMDVVIKRY